MRNYSLHVAQVRYWPHSQTPGRGVMEPEKRKISWTLTWNWFLPVSKIAHCRSSVRNPTRTSLSVQCSTWIIQGRALLVPQQTTRVIDLSLQRDRRCEIHVTTHNVRIQHPISLISSVLYYMESFAITVQYGYDNIVRNYFRNETWTTIKTIFRQQYNNTTTYGAIKCRTYYRAR